MRQASQQVVLVTADDVPTGVMDVYDAHTGDGVRHRAFMILLYNDRGEVLLCRRSDRKRLWGGYWENSCSSHPLPDESCLEAARRRLQEELGICASLEEIGRFEYHACDGEAGAEYEVCKVFTGRCNGEIAPAAEEISACRWASLEELLHDGHLQSDHYAPWLSPGLRMAARHLQLPHSGDNSGCDRGGAR